MSSGRGGSVARRVALGVVALIVSTLLAGCPGGATRAPRSPLEQAREDAAGSSDAEVLGRWLLAEMIAPGGELGKVAEARSRLAEARSRHWRGDLARAFDADVHGRFADAATAYRDALAGLRAAVDEDVPLWGWFVASRLAGLRGAVPNLWDECQEVVEGAMDDPGRLGWRARSVLVEWWSQQLAEDEGQDDAILERVRQRHGCLGSGELAGPFGQGALSDHRVHFSAEEPAPWPARFAADPHRRRPRRLKTESRGCLIAPDEPAPGGVYYVQSFIDLPAERDVIVAVQGAYSLFVDDHEVLTRDMAEWGVWPRFGVRLHLTAGRHRILGRLIQSDTSIRVLSPLGTPLELSSSADDGAPYAMVAPHVGRDPNPLEPWMRKAGVRPSPGPAAPVDAHDPIARLVASYLAHVEGQDDLASVIFEPLIEKRGDATPVALAQQAVFVDEDSIYPEGVGRDLARDLREQAAEDDPELWGPQLWLALDQRETQRPAEIVEGMKALAEKFDQVPAVRLQLAALYGQLGWQAERLQTLEAAAEAFGDDPEVLSLLMSAYERVGRVKDADAIAERLKKIDPQNEVGFRRALARRDWDAAIAELRRIGNLAPDRRDIALRVADLLVRAGRKQESLEQLEEALARDPDDAEKRMAVADARFARGDRDALTDALVEAIRTGADDRRLRYAIEMVEGMTDLEPFRQDGKKVIADLEASGEELPGTAARVLDYAAIWVAPDGRARMLEHEILKIQSREGIQRHVEQNIPRGVVLRMRTIKADGTVFEPEIVAGKPTVTMPHLEVGDYIETESIWNLRGASDQGRRFLAPRWFFREENTSYHRSELVIVIPQAIDAKIEPVVETTGSVPEAEVERKPGIVVRRWRVDGSVALVEEPNRPPVTEFLPSVRFGWGIDLTDQLRRIQDAQVHVYPRDPRMVRIAESVVRGKLGKGNATRLSIDEKARRVYRWVLETIEPGEENAPPKIITGKSGDRTQAFLYLCRLVGVDARLGLVHDRLAPPAEGPISEAQRYTVPAVRVKTEEGSRWMLVQERFAPYGYLPGTIRDQPAVVIQPPGPIVTVEPPPLETETTSASGADNSVSHEAEVTLAKNGSATMELTQKYEGAYAIGLRSALSKVLPSRREDVVEAKLLGLALPGGQLTSLEMPSMDDLDEPLVMKMGVEVPNFARLAEGELVIAVPFLGSLAPLVQLPTRETPLYIPERAAVRIAVTMRVQLPAGAKVVTPLAPTAIDGDQLVVEVKDRMDGDTLVIERRGRLPAGRIQPDKYPAFREKVLRGDDALNKKLRIRI